VYLAIRLYSVFRCRSSLSVYSMFGFRLSSVGRDMRRCMVGILDCIFIMSLPMMLFHGQRASLILRATVVRKSVRNLSHITR